MMNVNHAVQFQHCIWDECIVDAQVVIDATCGNGNDLLYVWEKAYRLDNRKCEFIGIDIQKVAIEQAKAKLSIDQHSCNHRDDAKKVTLLVGSHDILIEQIGHRGKRFDLVLFNLGYLPGGDHTITTQIESTLAAISSSMKYLSTNGYVTIVAYPGTTYGHSEQEAVEDFLSQQCQKQFDISMWKPINQINRPPQLYIIKRR